MGRTARMVMIVGVLGIVELPAGALGAVRGGRASRGCCVEVFLPGITPEPRCALVNLNLRPRRLRRHTRAICRLIGGRPLGRDGCPCRPEAPA
jgi:hypothetical protein